MTIVLVYALVAAIANLAGGLLITTSSRTGIRFQRLLLGFGAGFMVAVVFLSMLPHAMTDAPGGALWVVAGYLLVHITQHVLTPHFHFGEETHKSATLDQWVGVAALLGLLLHTFFDGVAITSGFDVDTELGLLVFLAVFFHKVPEGVTVASIMMVSGNSERKALIAVLLLGVSTLAGVLMTAWIEPLAEHGLALSAGVTLYVAASNLMPEVQKEHDLLPAMAVFAGVGLYIAARALLGGLGVT